MKDAGARPVAGLVLAALAAFAFAIQGPRAAAAADKTDEIVDKATAYVVNFLHRFTDVVAEERYVQDAKTLNIARGKTSGSAIRGVSVHRELASDFLLVAAPGLGGWHAFRDIFEVDGRPVRDREERLASLFAQASANALEKALEIEREGARFNLGDAVRTINNPLMAVAFLQPNYRPRFRFSFGDADPDAGPGVVVVEYREQARPTLLRRRPDADLPAKGRYWIESRSGRVVKTELAVSESDQIVTTYRFDPQLELDVPVEMSEQYWTGNTFVSGTASYGRFRRFTVSTEERIAADDQITR